MIFNGGLFEFFFSTSVLREGNLKNRLFFTFDNITSFDPISLTYILIKSTTNPSLKYRDMMCALVSWSKFTSIRSSRPERYSFRISGD